MVLFYLSVRLISACGSSAAIEIPSIIQKGSRDEFVSLSKGGRIHLRMSFVLTDEERKKIERMVRHECICLQIAV